MTCTCSRHNVCAEHLGMLSERDEPRSQAAGEREAFDGRDPATSSPRSENITHLSLGLSDSFGMLDGER